MKTIILVRHAKSSWKDTDLKDRERPLKKRGERDAALMANVLRDRGFTPALIITSHAKRAEATAKIIASEYGHNEKLIDTRRKLYMRSGNKMINVINDIDDRHDVVFLVSHNPGLTDLANLLTNDSIDNIPTSGVVAISFDVQSWSEVASGKGKKLLFEVPKTHRAQIEKVEEPVL